MTDLADRLAELGAKATAGEWEVRDHVVSPPHNLDRVKITPQHGPLGSLDRPDAELIVTLANNRQTFIDALRRVDALKADLDQKAKLKWEAYDANKRQAAEIARLREALERANEAHWYYLGDDCSSDQCRFGIDECITEDFEWDNKQEGDHVLQISGAKPVPDMWVALRYFTEAEMDERQDDAGYVYTVHATEEEARQALKENNDDA